MRLLAAVAATLAVAPAGALAGERHRDPFFPRSGNTGYDVLHYDARLAYRPADGWLDGRLRIEARATQGLRRFALDLVGLRVRSASIDGEAAAVRRGREKLKLKPASRLASEEGWVRTDDGALAVGEPLGTATWLPCNNTLTDKASFDFRLVVPRSRWRPTWR